MEETDEVFFVQNAGHKDAGTGIAKSAVIEKVALAQAAAASNDSVETVDVTTVNPTKVIPNPNGMVQSWPECVSCINTDQQGRRISVGGSCLPLKARAPT